MPGLRVAGAAAGAFSTACRARGRGRGGDGGAGRSRHRRARRGPAGAEDAPAAVGALWQVEGRGGRAWLDLQNDVTVKDVELAARENYARSSI